MSDATAKDCPKGKSVLLFSGGMDSLMAAHLLRPGVLLYVRHGSRYGPQEEAAIDRLQAHGHCAPVTYAALEELGKYERADAIIPMRNLFFLALAAQYGETLYMGAMEGDRSLDKSPQFFSDVQRLFTYLYQGQHWCEGRAFQVLAPFKGHTKTQLVREYLAAGGRPEALLASLSCYAPVAGGPCGHCKPCLRKWVALQNNGMGPSFAATCYQHPKDAPWLPGVWPQVLGGTYRGREDAEWVKALGGRA